MFARANARHHQIAYVTNDIEAAIAMFETVYAAPGFFLFSNVGSGAHRPGEPELRIALTNVGGVEIELIEPIGDTAPLFGDALEGGDGLIVRFHHVCVRVDGDLGAWTTYAASIDPAAHKVVFSGGMGDELRFFYTDEQPRLGHYVEHVWMAPSLLAQMRAAVPHHPAAA